MLPARVFRRVRIVTAIQVLLAFQAPLTGQAGHVLRFTNGQERFVVANVGGSIASIEVTETEFDATVVSVGRANALAPSLLDKLKVGHRELYDQILKITTAAEVTQGSQSVYVRGLRSANLAVLRTGAAKVRCRVYLLEIRSQGESWYLPIIRTVRTLSQ